MPFRSTRQVERAAAALVVRPGRIDAGCSRRWPRCAARCRAPSVPARSGGQPPERLAGRRVPTVLSDREARTRPVIDFANRASSTAEGDPHVPMPLASTAAPRRRSARRATVTRLAAATMLTVGLCWPAVPAAAATTDVDTAAELAAAFQRTGAEDQEIVRLTGDIDVTAEDNAISVATGAGVVLDLNDHALTITGQAERAAIEIPETSDLIIRDAGTRGTLTAVGGQGAAGIGGNAGRGNGAITINDGTVDLKGGERGAGIGGGANGAGGAITVNGGTITARGSLDAAAIGGGANGDGGTIAVNGGDIRAINNSNGAGIGGGGYAAAGSITVTAGRVEASGGAGGAGIGSGSESDAGGSITIDGGTVHASSHYSAGIGGGSGGEPIASITINQGTVTARSSSGAGIGGGREAGTGPVTINGGTVEATNTGFGSAIGAGVGSHGSAVTIGKAAVVSATSESGTAIGGHPRPEDEELRFGSLEIAGELTIPSGFLAIPDQVTVINSGVITGAGSISGGGTIENTGTIRKTIKVADSAKVTRNNYLVTYDPQGGTGRSPDRYSVYAPTLETAGYQVPTGPTRDGHRFLGWYPGPDKAGTRLAADTTLGQGNGPADVPYYAAWEATAAPQITGPESAAFTVGENGSYTPTVTGSPKPTVTATGLPDGLKINKDTGEITGAPSAGSEGSHLVTLKASNGTDPDAAFEVLIDVRPAPVTQFELQVTPTETRVGERLMITGSGLPEGTKINLELASDPAALGTATAGPDGSFEFSTTVPDGTTPGAHRVIGTADLDGRMIKDDAPVRILADQDPDAAAGDDEDPDAATDSDADPSDDDASGDADPADGEAAADDEEELPSTGTDLPLGLLIGAGCLLLTGSGIVLIGRSRRS
ncbi:putative Ig domain-containing protein [Microlunatus sp. GCM10028923]|uniref:putative Ig domain-containing protein n=1 Tax=Microlunatus sp. GCM10028923 TaxID=3273400 RepID=UPI003613B946